MLTYMSTGILRGFFIQDPSQALPTDPPNTVHRTMLRMQTQNNAGWVKIKSTDPRDTPDINFEYYSTGTESDIGGLIEEIAFFRRIFAKIPAPWGPAKTVEPPCPAGYDEEGYCLDKESDVQWIKDQTFGHHPVGTCKMGSRDDPMAVVDSKFRVFGVTNCEWLSPLLHLSRGLT
jgi:choline dehydrogenase